MDWKLLAIYVANLLSCLIYDVIAPFYPIEAEKKGISNFQVGLVFTAMPFAAFLASPPVGHYLGRIGRRNAFVLGNGLLGVSMALIGFSDLFDSTWFLVLGCLSRIVSGVGTAFVYTVSYAYIASEYPERMNSIIAITEVYSGLGLIIGPVIGAGFYYFVGYRGMFYGLALVFIFGSFALMKILGPDREYMVVDEGENGVASIYLRKEVLLNSMPLLLTMAAVGFTDTVIAPHLENAYGLSSVEIGLLWGITDSGYPIVSLILAKTIGRFNLLRANLVGILLTMLSYWLFGPWGLIFPQYLALVVIGLTLIGVAIGVHYVITLPNLIEVATLDLHLAKDDILIDSLSSVVSSSTSLGEMMGPLIAGWAVDRVGTPDAGGMLGLCSLVFALGYFFYILRVKRTKSRLNEGLTEVSGSEINIELK